MKPPELLVMPKHSGAVGVAPEDVGLAVAVEVADAGDLPAGLDDAEVLVG